MSRLAVPFKQIFPQFLLDERGAISLDWVILTAGAVVLAIGAFSVFGPVGKGKIGDEHAHLSFQFLEQQKNDVAYNVCVEPECRDRFQPDVDVRINHNPDKGAYAGVSRVYWGQAEFRFNPGWHAKSGRFFLWV